MKINKENFTNDTLRKLQLTQVEILNEIVRVCEKFNLRYYLVGGTLLGAIRHQGFIPWDEDLDIAMPREDYDKFIALCKTQLDERYYLHCSETDENYWLIFAKVRKKGTELNEYNIRNLSVPKGIYVDIFPFDNATKEDYFRKKVKTKIIKILYALICYKIGIEINTTGFIKNVLRLTKPFSIKFLSKIADRLMRSENNKETAYYVNYGSNYNTVKQTIPKDKYEPSVKVKFEDGYYTAPGDYDYVLRRIYNDYMQLPPEDKRILRHKPEYVDFGD